MRADPHLHAAADPPTRCRAPPVAHTQLARLAGPARRRLRLHLQRALARLRLAAHRGAGGGGSGAGCRRQAPGAAFGETAGAPQQRAARPSARCTATAPRRPPARPRARACTAPPAPRLRAPAGCPSMPGQSWRRSGAPPRAMSRPASLQGGGGSAESACAQAQRARRPPTRVASGRWRSATPPCRARLPPAAGGRTGRRGQQGREEGPRRGRGASGRRGSGRLTARSTGSGAPAHRWLG